MQNNRELINGLLLFRDNYNYSINRSNTLYSSTNNSTTLFYHFKTVCIFLNIDCPNILSRFWFPHFQASIIHDRCEYFLFRPRFGQITKATTLNMSLLAAQLRALGT